MGYLTPITIAITAMIAAIIAMVFAQYELHKALRAIDKVSASILERRASSCSFNQTRENSVLSSGVACEPESMSRTLVSPSDSNSVRHAAILSSCLVTESSNARVHRRAERSEARPSGTRC